MGSACTFFGHRDVPDGIYPKIVRSIEYLVTEKSVKDFYVGHNGKFDALAAKALKYVSEKYPISYSIVLAYMPNNSKNSYIEYDKSVYPEGMENCPPRFSIDRRNRWMLSKSDYVIAYVWRLGGARKYFDIASKAGKTVINLFDGG